MLRRLVWLMMVLGTGGMARACPDEDMPRELVLALFKDWVLGRMGLEAPPVAPALPPGWKGPRRRPGRSSSAAVAEEDHKQDLDVSQVIVFPSSDSPCGRTEVRDAETATFHSYHFQPSVNPQELLITSAHFWFYAGPESNSSSPLYILNSGQHPDHLAAVALALTSSDGWATYDLDDHHRPAKVYSGPLTLEVRCTNRLPLIEDPDKTPFLHLRARRRVSGRWPRHAIPWSQSAADLLQRPSQQQPESRDCWRDAVEISFDELGWGNWIVHPKVVTFSYCHGNCSAPDRGTALLGIKQCCAPVPESMRSLRITTTSDGGYSFMYETLPNIIPEECSCF
ncbi:inhibin alpha chain-like [Gadus chalcogrammus]|uniref:inhibin alpha chain-like n=1 Tax=Gadus chalcogrammus TaxID=1042646 RepID=UPI0024C2EA56|nr:inhibin alpha chain-like [Gadus chalcogrammus]XP_056467469.1 inhibin alpha chain-like [Gadus chalcogrammus]